MKKMSIRKMMLIGGMSCGVVAALARGRGGTPAHGQRAAAAASASTSSAAPAARRQASASMMGCTRASACGAAPPGSWRGQHGGGIGNTGAPGAMRGLTKAQPARGIEPDA